MLTFQALALRRKYFRVTLSILSGEKTERIGRVSVDPSSQLSDKSSSLSDNVLVLSDITLVFEL